MIPEKETKDIETGLGAPVHRVEDDVVAVRLLRVHVAAHLLAQVRVLGVVAAVEHEHLG